MSLHPFPVTLVEAYMLSSSVKHFVLQCAIQPSFTYLPGQFITIHFQHEEKVLKRSYSIANAPKTDNRIEFAATFVEGGPGSTFLFNLKVGDIFNITGPYGRLILKEERPKRYILVATSTGVTPYKAMLPTLSAYLEKDPNFSVIILQGVSFREDILYAEELQAFARAFPNQATFVACLSREKGEVGAYEYSGRVQDLFHELQLTADQDIVYLCGNPSMIDAAFQYLQEQGFLTQHIVREKYISR